jgi:hypothetical protein
LREILRYYNEKIINSDGNGSKKVKRAQSGALANYKQRELRTSAQ